jgi:hypothetical protein
LVENDETDIATAKLIIMPKKPIPSGEIPNSQLELVSSSLNRNLK